MRALALSLAVVFVTIPAVATTARATTAATEVEPIEEAPGPDATCDVDPKRSAQLVTCVMGGMAPHGAAAITVTPSGDASTPGPFIGGTTVGEDGTARLEVEVPCALAGPSDVEVAGPSMDGGRFRHVEPVALEGGCRAAWELEADEWTTVLATVLVVAAALLVTVLLRRQRHRRRRRSVRGGPVRPRRSTTRGPGRRRSPRRRRRRLRR